MQFVNITVFTHEPEGEQDIKSTEQSFFVHEDQLVSMLRTFYHQPDGYTSVHADTLAALTPEQREAVVRDSTPEPSAEQIRAAQFVREDLWPIIERARVLAETSPSPLWKRAYCDLGQAASTVDAFLARSTVQGSPC